MDACIQRNTVKSEHFFCKDAVTVNKVSLLHFSLSNVLHEVKLKRFLHPIYN